MADLYFLKRSKSMKYPFIVAECGINGNGSVDTNIEMVHAAKSVGANAVKFQLFTERARPKAKKYILSEKQWQKIAKVGTDLDIPVFWSVFDFESVELAARLNAPMIKLSIIERRNSRLIEKCNALFHNKPKIVSVDLWEQYNKEELADWHKLYCPNNGWSGIYPTNDTDIEWEEYKAILSSKEMGWSDHCSGISTAVVVSSIGANIIEKHFKFDDNCIDAKCSVNPEQFAQMVKQIRILSSYRLH